MLLNFLRGGRALHLWESTYIYTTKWRWGVHPQSHTPPVKNKAQHQALLFLDSVMFQHVIRLALPLVGSDITVMVDWALNINYLSMTMYPSWDE